MSHILYRSKRQSMGFGFLCIFTLILVGFSSPIYGETVKVSIIDNKYSTSERIEVINDVIFSNDTKIVADNVMHKGASNEFNTYYLGWQAALNNTISFDLSLTKTPVGDIVITLNNYQHPTGMAGFTKFHNGIAIIDIYTIENLSEHELQMILRHELGHALGLEHTRNKADLMYPIIPYYTAYISVENADKIIKNY